MTWSIHIRYRPDGAISSIHSVPTEKLPRLEGLLAPAAGDHLIGPFENREAARRALRAVVRETDRATGSWRRGALKRLDSVFGLRQVTPEDSAPPAEPAQDAGR